MGKEKHPFYKRARENCQFCKGPAYYRTPADYVTGTVWCPNCGVIRHP